MRLSWCLALVFCAVLASVHCRRIVGGAPTDIETYPSLVQVERQDINTEAWSQSCAATILTAQTVLTAAHCFHGELFEDRLRRIRAGTTYRNYGGDISYVKYSINHPDYNVASRYDSDISIVRLANPLIYSPFIQRGTIVAHGSVIPDNLPVVHAGWGATEQGGKASDVLLDVSIYTINHDVCRERYATLEGRPPVTENMICAGLKDVGGADACQGDSGGPMYYGQIVIGVVSWGEGCANATFPGISTAVSPFTPWIVENSY
ncbi:trypsin, alkaline C-like [Bicyclus anynana]|uniref:Trypsin, alkaline C-like n=1 Tax=Bicyclus anynana TaxID=110368 RepID=A0A6J1MNR9_BICAN|nr:trypsin, alkaline C-like [Bicyclus anynana]